MHIEFLLEEPSAAAALGNLLPRIVGPGVTFRFISFQGKADLLSHLESRLRAYRTWLPDDSGVVVLLDADADDCHSLKARLEQTALRAGLRTKSTAAPGSRFQVLNRLAIEELEAWFLGDLAAIRQAYPGVPESAGRRRRFRDPDAVPGGTGEALERLLQRAGYHRSGLRKIEAARAISQHLVPDRNRSHSFQVFRQGLIELVRQG